jgi:hypothetical protein
MAQLNTAKNDMIDNSWPDDVKIAFYDVATFP